MTLFYIDSRMNCNTSVMTWAGPTSAPPSTAVLKTAHYDLSNLDPRLDGLTANAGFTYTKATSEGDKAVQGP